VAAQGLKTGPEGGQEEGNRPDLRSFPRKRESSSSFKT